MEIWKDTIEDAEHYEVSSFGIIRNKKTGKILKCNQKKNGYLQVTLAYGKHKDLSIHRIVAKAFIPNPNNYKYVNHKDENKHNNNVENLEWCTMKYNNNYGVGCLARNSKVYQINRNTGKIIKEWKSMKDASENLGICYQTISACCRNKKGTAGGYFWEYVSGVNEKQWKSKSKSI